MAAVAAVNLAGLAAVVLVAGDRLEHPAVKGLVEEAVQDLAARDLAEVVDPAVNLVLAAVAVNPAAVVVNPVVVVVNPVVDEGVVAASVEEADSAEPTTVPP